MTYEELYSLTAADYFAMFWWVGLIVLALLIRFIRISIFGK